MGSGVSPVLWSDRAAAGTGDIASPFSESEHDQRLQDRSKVTVGDVGAL